MSQGNGIIIAVGPNGPSLTKGHIPSVPTTTEEIVAEAKRCESEGAGLIHLHVRDAAGKPTDDPDRFCEAVAAVKAETNLVVQVSSAGMAGVQTAEERLRHLVSEPHSSSCTVGSFNFINGLFASPPETIEQMTRGILGRGLILETEIFDTGMQVTAIALWRRLAAELNVRQRPFVGLTFGATGGFPSEIEIVAHVARTFPPDFIWGAAGVGRTYWPVAAWVASLGGHLKVGYEYSTRLSDGRRAGSNAELVVQAVQLAKLLGRTPLSGRECRQLLQETALPADASSSQRS